MNYISVKGRFNNKINKEFINNVECKVDID